MGQVHKGVLIYNEWFEAMQDLSASDFKRILWAVYRYQIYGEKPMEFKGKAKPVATMIFPCIDRRLEYSAYGSVGASIKKNQTEDQSGATKGASRGASRGAWAISKQNKTNPSYPISKAESDDDQHWREFFEAAVARSLGEAAK